MSDKSDKLNKKVDLMLFFGQEPAVRQYSSFTWRFCELLGVVFIALKCAGNLQWGWFFVTMPLWGWLWVQILLSLAYRALGLKEMDDNAEEERLVKRVKDGNRVIADPMRMALEEMCEDIAVVQMESENEKENEKKDGKGKENNDSENN